MKPCLVNLKGGAKVLFDRQTDVNGISVSFIFRAGAINDPAGKLGVAHFCEHALCSFANAKMTRVERESYRRKFQYFNAGTSSMVMSFEIETIAKNFDDAIDFMTESFASIKFSQEDFEIEQKIIRDEIKTPQKVNSRLWFKIYNTEILDDKDFNKIYESAAGSEESFEKIQIDDLKEFINKYISLDNLVVSVVGNISKSKAVKTLKKYLESRLKISGTLGYDDRKEYNFTANQMHYRKAIEEGKAGIIYFYPFKHFAFSSELPRDIRVAKIVNSYFNEKVFSFFRGQKNLCYFCGGYIYEYVWNLVSEVAVECQEENIKEVIDSYQEFLNFMPNEISIEDFAKHYNKVVESYNFDFSDLMKMSKKNYTTYWFENKLLTKKERKKNLTQLASVTYQEANKLYKELLSVKPHILLIASKNYLESYDYEKMVLTKN